MMKLVALVQAYATKEDGATAIEYGLIASGIALAIAGAVWVFGGQLEALFESMGGALVDGGAGGGTE